MHEHALSLLDFYRIRDDVAAYCLSEEGAAAIRGSLPSGDPAAVADSKARASAVRELFRDRHGMPPGSFAPIDGAARVVSKPGTCLAVEELWALGMWADAYTGLARWMGGARHEALAAEAGSAPDLSPVAAAAFRIVGPDGEVKDLPELRDIRSRIRRLNGDIERVTASFFQDEATRSMLQSDLPTQRDGRTVLAVKAGSKARVKGIVHEVSSTGQTVYIEPESLVQKNNELVEEEARYLRELQRVLRETTARLHGFSGAIQGARVSCASLDGLFAKARYSHMNDGVFAEDSPSGIELVRARHPVLGSKAVPIDLRMPEGARTLIVTGPNTGGKTVSLKTAGLFSLMNQFGLAIPAAYGSALPVFDGVWADIGDEQSMDQSLSTFSGHMKAISAIVAGATGRSLVLLDELGSGTDPEEGCAIAMALLDLFIDRGALTLVTTHHGILKNFGYTKEGVLNASVDFDKDTLSPTYRIMMGVPGESRALDIAQKNGVAMEVVEGARLYLREERTDISALISGLSDKHRELDSLRDEEKRRLRDAMEEQRKADLKELKLRQKESELRTQGVSELNNLLSESRKTLENLVRELREGELTKAKTQEVKEFLSGLEAQVEAKTREARSQERGLKAGARPPARIAEGSPVLVLPARRRGTALRAVRGGKWLVETDALRITVDEADLELTAALEPKAPSVSIESSSSRGNRAVIELDLRGYRLVEAIAALERQLDAATMENLSGFSIIHGTGEGVLQQGVKETLARYPGIKEFHYARPEEGGHGKTIVVFG
ncbi:MAG: endonuclease MutS2 [Spirochaetes bacterium]|nr:endonuclease MutS2 [Spirochaetota bacterium]MBU1079585.1 endonuclease MutS2 [Spirochaetota bacterium]